VGTIVGQFFGITPAPYPMRLTAERKRKAEAERKVEPTSLQKKQHAR
jgi:hypothetical protein